MIKSVKLLSAAALLCSAYFLPAGASAQWTVVSPPWGASAANVMIGSVYGYPVVAYMNVTQTQCSFALLDYQQYAPLPSNYHVDLDDNPNTAWFVNTPTYSTACGLNTWWEPLNYGGKLVNLYGLGGNDVLIGPTVGWLQACIGGEGDDTLHLKNQSNGLGHGGNDFFWNESTTTLVGHEGNDLFCTNNLAGTVSGGSGFDAQCGTAGNTSGVEDFSCNNACGIVLN